MPYANAWPTTSAHLSPVQLGARTDQRQNNGVIIRAPRRPLNFSRHQAQHHRNRRQHDQRDTPPHNGGALVVAKMCSLVLDFFRRDASGHYNIIHRSRRDRTDSSRRGALSGAHTSAPASYYTLHPGHDPMTAKAHVAANGGRIAELRRSDACAKTWRPYGIPEGVQLY